MNLFFMRFAVCCLFLLLCSSALRAQFFFSGAYSQQWLRMPRLEAIIDTFNTRENHTLPKLRSLSGFQATVGGVQTFAIVELGVSNAVRRLRSFSPNQLRENAEIVASHTAINFSLGFRPLQKQFLFVGVGLNFGLSRLRHSFGGDYVVTLKKYNLAPEIFFDYSIKIRFLLKPAQREKMFYLLRLRPFYQFHFPYDLTNTDTQLNGAPSQTPQSAAYAERWNNFGFRIGLVIPFFKSEK